MDKEAEKIESLPFPGEKMFNRLVHKVDLMSPARGSVIEAYRLAQQDMLEAGYRKLPKLPKLPDDIEITELAELLYNFREAMDIKSIKANIESFLLANHYIQLPKDKPLLIPDSVIPAPIYGNKIDIVAYLEAQRDSDWEYIKKHYEGK